MFETSEAFIEEALKAGVFPSAAFAVGVRDRVLARRAWGKTCIEEPADPITEHTLYDMASLSKVIGTTMVAFRLIEEGKLSLQDEVGDFFDAPADKREISVFQLMTHTSGIPAHFLLSRYASGPEDVVRAILSYPLAAPSGSETIYTCMGYILLGKILETIEGQPLDVLAKRLVFGPLGMTETTYCPQRDLPAACTEKDPETGKYLRGVVHDENARFLKGVSGNAGVFSTLHDMIRFATMLSCGGKLAGKAFLSPAMFSKATRSYTQGLSENRGLGFQLVGSRYSFMGDLFPKSSFGHTGFTGTSLAIDPESGLYVVLLTNRVHPTRENNRLTRFRKLLHNRVACEYSYSRAKGKP